MCGGARLRRWEDTGQKLLHSFPTSNFDHQACRRGPLFAETSHQFPENFLPYVCVCSCVWAHAYAGMSPQLHSTLFTEARCLTDSLSTSWDLQITGRVPCLPCCYISYLGLWTPVLTLGWQVLYPKSHLSNPKPLGLWERLWLPWVEYLRAALLLVFRETSTIVQHKFFQSIWDFNSIWNPAGFITRMNDYKADACKWRDKKIKGHMKFSVCCL